MELLGFLWLLTDISLKQFVCQDMPCWRELVMPCGIICIFMLFRDCLCGMIGNVGEKKVMPCCTLYIYVLTRLPI